MNERQRAFADYYIECGNATEAAKKAGYSEKTAYSIGQRTLKQVEVSEYIKTRLDALQAQRIASANEVMEFYTAVMRGEEKEPKGKAARLDTRINAARELMKRYDISENAREDKQDDGLKAALSATTKVVCGGQDDSAMLPEDDDDKENG